MRSSFQGVLCLSLLLIACSEPVTKNTIDSIIEEKTGCEEEEM